MRRLALFLSLIAIGFFSQCKKGTSDEEVIPLPEIDNPDGMVSFLRKLSVPEAESVTFDSLRSGFSVKLPQGFDKDEIKINLSLFPGITLLDSTEREIADSTLVFRYKGNRPLGIVLSQKGTNERSVRYELFVEVIGSINIELTGKEISINTNNTYLPLKVISGLGTIPSKPDQQFPSIRLIDRAKNIISDGTVQSNLQSVFFQDVTRFLTSEKIALELTFEGSNSIIFEDILVKKGLPKAIFPINSFKFSTTDTVKVGGGYFSPSAKYTAAFTNDFTNTPVIIDLVYSDLASLSGQVPKGVPEGSYLVTFYENGTEIGKSLGEFSENKLNSVETIWKGDLSLAFTRNTERITLNKGEIFYAKPSTVQYAWGTGVPVSSFDVKLLPLLRLANASSTIDLAPEVVVISWAIAGISYSIGKYTIPSGQTSGMYSVTYVYANQPVSKPYWSRLTVQ